MDNLGIYDNDKTEDKYPQCPEDSNIDFTKDQVSLKSFLSNRMSKIIS